MSPRPHLSLPLSFLCVGLDMPQFLENISFCWGWYKNLLTQEVNAPSTRRQDVWWDRMVLGWPRLFLLFLPLSPLPVPSSLA